MSPKSRKNRAGSPANSRATTPGPPGHNPTLIADRATEKGGDAPSGCHLGRVGGCMHKACRLFLVVFIPTTRQKPLPSSRASAVVDASLCRSFSPRSGLSRQEEGTCDMQNGGTNGRERHPREKGRDKKDQEEKEEKGRMGNGKWESMVLFVATIGECREKKKGETN